MYEIAQAKMAPRRIVQRDYNTRCSVYSYHELFNCIKTPNSTMKNKI